VVPWEKVPFLWGYQVLPRAIPSHIPPMAYPAFNYFRDCYKSTVPCQGVITSQRIFFMDMKPHPIHSAETLQDNCFDEDQMATLYTVFIPDHNPVFFLHRFSDLFEVMIV
jgi:hypothetical protein